MNEVKYFHNWSGGKDSTASVILDHIHGLPPSEIVMSEVMFDKRRGISGELPEHMDWVKNIAVPKFEEWGYKVHILHADKDYLDCFYHVRIRSKNSLYNGKFDGFPFSGKCALNKPLKVTPIKEFYKQVGGDYVQYVGIASDEPERLKCAHNRGQVSLLERYGYTEEMARDLCEEYGLLSPMYNYSNRGGCWFCPSATYAELAHTKKCYPELWAELEKLSQVPDTVCRGFKYGVTFEEVNSILDFKERQLTFFD